MITVLSIVLSMVLVFWFVGPQRDHIHLAHDYHMTQETVEKVIKYISVIILILTVPLLWLTYENVMETVPEREISYVISQEEYSKLGLGSIKVGGDDVEVTIYVTSGVDPESIRDAYYEIRNRIGNRYSLTFNLVRSTNYGG
jgi:hypothetical protein